MILHLLLDEKVMGQIVANMQALSSNHRFMVLGRPGSEGYQHLDPATPNLFRYHPDRFEAFVQEQGITAILLHGYQVEFAQIILGLKEKPLVAWVVWGFDVYGLPRIKPHTYAPETRRWQRKHAPLKTLGRALQQHSGLRRLALALRPGTDRYEPFFQALSHTRFFVTYLREDFELFSRYYPHDLDYIHCTFNSIDQYLGGQEDLRVKEGARHILVGNSNTPESNHLDVFLHLQTHAGQWKGAQVLTPLSYAGDPAYQEQVIAAGRKRLGQSFVPLTEFMDRAEYVRMLSSCSVGIFYHIRQQAMGNIIAMLYMGARVYLSPLSPVYAYLKRHGVTIFSLDADFPALGNTPLPTTEGENNRRILYALFRKDKVSEELAALEQRLLQAQPENPGALCT